MSNRNRNSDEALPELGSIEGQDIQTEGGGENNSRNVTNRRRRRNNRRRSGDNSPTIEQIESDAELEGQNNRRNNADNRHHRNNSHTSDDIPPGIERVGSDTEEQGDNVPFYEGDLSDENGEADFFLQPIWSTPELLDHTAETSGLPMEGSVLAWRGNGFGKSVIVGYACGGCATARLIPAARRPIPSRAPNISEQSLGRRRDYIRTERDIQGWGIVAWRVDKKSVDQDPISLLKPMDRAWYPETYVYIHWYGGEGSWESRLDLRFVHAGNELKTDMLIYNVAKEQEANYREALTGVRPEYPPANTHMINNHWRNVNAYRGAHWFQPRAEENRRMTTIGYEPVIPIEDNTQEFDNGIGISDSGIVQEASGEYQQGYYEDSIGGEEMDNVEGAEDVQNDREQGFGDMQQRQRDLSPIVEEGSVSGGGSFFTPNGSPSRVRWHGETQQRYGIFTPRATRSPSSGYIPQGNRDQGRRMPETPDNRRVTHLNRDNQRRTRQPNQGNQPDQGSGQRQTPQSNRSNRFNQPGNQQRTPQSNQSNQPDQGIGQRQTPQSNRSNRSNQPSNQQRTPPPSQGNQPDQGIGHRQTPQIQTPQSNRSNRFNQPSNQQRTPPPSQGNQPDQGIGHRQTPQIQTPQSNRSNRSNQPSNQQRTPPPSQGNQPDQGIGHRQTPQIQTPQSNRSNRSNQPSNQQRTPPPSQGNQPDQGIGQRQTPQSNRSNRSNQPGNQQRTPQSNQGNQPDQGSQQRQTPQSNRSNRSNQPSNQQRTPPPNQGNQPDQGSQQRQTPQSNRSNRSNQPGNQQRTPQSNQGNQPDQGSQQRQTPQSNRSSRSNHIDHPSTESTGSSTAMPEGNRSLTQVRRGRGRPRRPDRTNIPNITATRRSARLNSVLGRP